MNKKPNLSVIKKYLPQPLFLAFCGFFFLVGKGTAILYALLALSIHEGAHYLVARKRGYLVGGFSLTPFGATMSFDNGLAEGDEFAVAAAGPIVNLLLCPALVSLWWFFPATYPYTLSLFRSSFALALFNLLPLYPFDGGRMLFSLWKDKIKLLKQQKIISIVSGTVFAIMGTLLFIFHKNFIFLFVAVTIVRYGVFPPKDQRYYLLFSQMEVFSSHRPMERRDVYAEGSVRLSALLRRIRSNAAFYVVHVTENGMERGVIKGEELNRLFFADRKKTIGELLRNDQCRSLMRPVSK